MDAKILKSSTIKIGTFFLFTGSERMVKLLIENGADVNAVNRYANTALMEAISEGIRLKIVNSYDELMMNDGMEKFVFLF